LSNTLIIERALKDLILNNKREFVALISGEWGIGKTYFWNEFKEKYLQNQKNVVYISLFGLNSLDEIKHEIIIQLSKYTKYLNKYRDKIKSLKGGNIKSNDISLSISGQIVNSSLSLFSTNDFKNIVICFDDFERLSEKISLKDVMGLISQFKEQKECKVLMILNEKELNKLSDIDGKKHDEIFALYKEKVVDYTFQYQPSFNKVFDIVEKDIEYFNKEWIYDFFKKIDLKNIRIMKQVIYHLNHFNFIEAYQLEDEVIKEFVEIALKLFIFKAKCNYTFKELNKILEYHSKKVFMPTLQKEFGIDIDKEIPHNKKYENCIEKNQYILYSDDTDKTKDIEKIIYTFIDTYFIDRKKLKKLLNDNNNFVKNYYLRDTITTLRNNFYEDFSTTNEVLSQNILTELKKNRTTLYKLYSYENFKDIIDFIKQFIKDKTIDSIEEEFIKKYIEENYLTAKYNYNNSLEIIQKTYTWADKYILKLQKSHQVNNQNNIFDIFQQIIDRENLGLTLTDGYKLSNVSVKEYKELILSSKDFVNLLIKFLSKHKHSWQELEQAQENIKKALIEIKNMNDDFSWKVDEIVKKSQISLEY